MNSTATSFVWPPSFACGAGAGGGVGSCGWGDGLWSGPLARRWRRDGRGMQGGRAEARPGAGRQGARPLQDAAQLGGCLNRHDVSRAVRVLPPVRCRCPALRLRRQGGSQGRAAGDKKKMGRVLVRP